MLNDYKPTHDPNIDTLQVQYLLGGSALLAVLFPYRYEITEVHPLPPSPPQPITNTPVADALGLQHLARIRRHSPATIHAAANGRSGDDNDTLSFRAGAISGVVYSKLAV